MSSTSSIIDHATESDLQQSRDQLAAELEGMRRLHAVSTRLLSESDLDALFQEIVDAAIEITHADTGTLQLCDGGDGLRIAAFRGLDGPVLAFFDRVAAGQDACGAALARGERVIVEDCSRSKLFAGPQALASMQEAGIRGLQSTPLIDHSGTIVGVLSTHYARPHCPSERDLRLLDLLARQAADLIERTQSEKALRDSEDRLRTVLEILPTGVWLADADGIITYGNEAGRRIWAGAAHVGPEDFGQYKARWVESGEIIAPDEWAVSRAVRHGETSHAELIEIEAFDGSRKTIQNSATPIRDQTGTIQGVVVVNEDISGLLETEGRLRRSEERLRAAQDLSLDAFAILSAVRDENEAIVDFVIDHANPKAAELSGLPAERLVGRRLLEVVPGHRIELFDRYVRVVETGEAHDIEFPYEADGLSGWFRNMAVKLGDGIAVSFSDITARKQTEAALRRSEERFRRIADSNMIGIFFWREDGLITEANDAFLRMIGYAPEDVAANRLNCWSLTPPGWEAADGKALEEVRSHEVSGAFEKEYRHKDGHNVPVLMGSATLAGDEAWVCWVLDISGRKQAEQALRESEHRFRSIFESVQDPVFVHELDEFDRPLRFLEVNEATLSTYGYSREELAEITLEQLIAVPAANERVPAQVATMRREGSLLVESEHQTRAGERMQVEVRAQLVERAGREAVLSVVRDISAHKQQEEALRSFNETLEQRVSERTAEAERRAQQLQVLAAQLTEAEQRERRKLAQILHDHLQQLLVGAKMKAGMLRAGRTSGTDAAGDIERILGEAIDEARTLSHELSPQILFERGLVAALRWLVPRTYDKHGFIVQVDASRGAEPATEALKIFLFQAVREILLNAIKHSGVNEARVTIEARGVELCVTVADAGRGFDPAGVDTASSGEYVGLFGIRERLEALGGRMDIDSAPNAGVRVSIFAPASVPALELEAPASEADAAAQAPGCDTARGDAVRVLLVDDHRLVREGLRTMLDQNAGISVVGEAEDGTTAVAQAQRLQPEVVVMDVAMPNGGGVGATRAIREHLPGTRIVGLTMQDPEVAFAALQEAGAEVCVAKDIPATELIRAIRGEAPSSASPQAGRSPRAGK